MLLQLLLVSCAWLSVVQPSWPVLGCSTCPPFRPATNRTTGRSVLVSMATSLPVELPTIDRQTLGQPDDYKPTVALLGNGDILVASRAGNQPSKNAPPFHAIFWRSTDRGASFGRRQANHTHTLGAEFALHTLSDHTVLLIGGGGPDGGRVFRSTDHGYSFGLAHDFGSRSNYSSLELGWGMVEQMTTTANLPAGVYLFPGNSIWFSQDAGASWQPHVSSVVDGGWTDVDTFFGQSETPFLSTAADGTPVLTHVARVGLDASWDEQDGAQVWQSCDGGRSWQCTTQPAKNWCQHHPCTMIRKPHAPNPPIVKISHHQCANLSASVFGGPGTMYPHLLRLHDGRVLVSSVGHSPILPP